MIKIMFKKQIKKSNVLISLVFLVLISFTFLIVSHINGSQNFNSQKEKATLTKYVDGDTFYCDTDTQQNIMVRLIGVDTPESVRSDSSKNTQEGIIASNYIKQILPIGSTLYLEQDTNLKDKYGRELRYVWLHDTDDISVSSIQINMLNGILLKQKLAKTLFVKPNTKYKTQFLTIENKNN